ncbi:NAD(P)-binding domain-containing protein [Agromyces sp. H66]|uniref:NAD(P)-binding domain-containing protein n=1 Tax=Agromyces sp. H66 TaxID=2529859 RepID=UPI0010AAD8A5|nr:NAD(P)-binding domain-containing protein [Agromyces sp. H66]
MRHIDTVIIGAGQAGLAASHELTRRGHEHVVLERSAVGERWLGRRWDSQTLLTPNWMTRLPGHRYAGPHPDRFMSTAEFATLLRDYARGFAAPVESGVTVEALRFRGGWLEVSSTSGLRRARNVIIATGWCDVPARPAEATRLHPSIHSITPDRYRNPASLPAGGVLVVGASATGVQLADELRRAGRRVVLAVGGHLRLPRRYRGADIMEWLDLMGSLDRRIDDMPDPVAALREPSMQLVGGELRTIDLPSLAAHGVELVGRFVGADGRAAHFDAGLRDRVAAADRRMHRTLDRIDRVIDRDRLDVAAASRPVPFIPPEAPASVDLVGGGIRTVIWASGYRRDYRWLPPGVLDAHGELRHRYGVTELPGLMALGLRFQRTRRSSLIDGVGADAAMVAELAHARASASLTA